MASIFSNCTYTRQTIMTRWIARTNSNEQLHTRMSTSQVHTDLAAVQLKADSHWLNHRQTNIAFTAAAAPLNDWAVDVNWHLIGHLCTDTHTDTHRQCWHLIGHLCTDTHTQTHTHTQTVLTPHRTPMHRHTHTHAQTVLTPHRTPVHRHTHTDTHRHTDSADTS